MYRTARLIGGHWFENLLSKSVLVVVESKLKQLNKTASLLGKILVFWKSLRCFWYWTNYHTQILTFIVHYCVSDSLWNYDFAECSADRTSFRQCNSTDTCIPNEYVCDSYPDCPGGEDDDRLKCGKYRIYSSLCRNLIKRILRVYQKGQFNFLLTILPYALYVRVGWSIYLISVKHRFMSDFLPHTVHSINCLFIHSLYTCVSIRHDCDYWSYLLACGKCWWLVDLSPSNFDWPFMTTCTRVKSSVCWLVNSGK